MDLGVEHGNRLAAKVRNLQDPYGDIKPLLLITVDMFFMGLVVKKETLNIVDAADTTLPRQPLKRVRFCKQIHILTI